MPRLSRRSSCAPQEPAALAELPGSAVLRVETDSDSSSSYEAHVRKSDGYHAHVRKADGREVVVLVNKQFEAPCRRWARRP